MAEDDDVAAIRQALEDAAREGGKAEQQAVARIAVRPFGDDEIVADEESREHRARGNAERRHDEAAEGPGEDRQDQDEANEAEAAFALPG